MRSNRFTTTVWHLVLYKIYHTKLDRDLDKMSIGVAILGLGASAGSFLTPFVNMFADGMIVIINTVAPWWFPWLGVSPDIKP